VKDAVSLYCRLGFARKRNADLLLDSETTHPSWCSSREAASIRCGSVLSIHSDSDDDEDSLIRELNQAGLEKTQPVVFLVFFGFLWFFRFFGFFLYICPEERVFRFF
jgi:hypothetical protein